MREQVADHYRSKGYTIRQDVQVRGRSGTIHAIEMVAQGPLGNLVIAFEDAGGFEGPEMNAVRRAARDIGATPVVAARRFPEGLRRHAAQAGVVMLDDDALHAEEPPAPAPRPEELDYPPWPDPSAGRGDEDGPAPWPVSARGRVAASGPMEPTDLDQVVEDWGRQQEVARPKSTDPGFWKYPRQGETVQVAEQAPVSSVAARPKATFDWLPRDEASHAQEAPSPSSPARAARAAATLQAPRSGSTRVHGASPRAATRRSAPTTRAHRAGSISPTVWRWAAAGAAFGASAGAIVYALSRLLG